MVSATAEMLVTARARHETRALHALPCQHTADARAREPEVRGGAGNGRAMAWRRREAELVIVAAAQCERARVVAIGE